MKVINPKITCEKVVSDIHLQRGQTLTAWFQVSEKERIQVELRVDFNNKPEIFTDSNMMLNIKSFEHWKSIYDDY